MDEPPDLGYHRGGGRRDPDRARGDWNAGTLAGRSDRYFVARAALFVHPSPRRRSHACVDVWISENSETPAQKYSGSRRRPAGLFAGAAGKPAHRAHLCKGTTDCNAGGKPDGTAQGCADEAQQLFQPVQHRVCRGDERRISAGHRLLRIRHPDRHHELRQPDGDHAAGGAGAKPICQPDGVSAAVLFHAGQRRAPDGSGSVCTGQRAPACRRKSAGVLSHQADGTPAGARQLHLPAACPRRGRTAAHAGGAEGH